MATEDSLLYSQQPATETYTESLLNVANMATIYIFKVHFNIIPPSTPI